MCNRHPNEEAAGFDRVATRQLSGSHDGRQRVDRVVFDDLPKKEPLQAVHDDGSTRGRLFRTPCSKTLPTSADDEPTRLGLEQSLTIGLERVEIHVEQFGHMNGGSGGGRSVARRECPMEAPSYPGTQRQPRTQSPVADAQRASAATVERPTIPYASIPATSATMNAIT